MCTKNDEQLSNIEQLLSEVKTLQESIKATISELEDYENDLDIIGARLNEIEKES